MNIWYLLMPASYVESVDRWNAKKSVKMSVCFLPLFHQLAWSGAPCFVPALLPPVCYSLGLASLCVFSEIPSPKMSQTPPPSPAEYHDQLGKVCHVWQCGLLWKYLTFCVSGWVDVFCIKKFVIFFKNKKLQGVEMTKFVKEKFNAVEISLG